MPYGRVNATVMETDNGKELTIRVLLPEQGEPARSGRSDNLGMATSPRLVDRSVM